MPGAFLMVELSPEARARSVEANYIHWGGLGLLFSLGDEVTASVLAQTKANSLAPVDTAHFAAASVAQMALAMSSDGGR